MFDPKQPKPPAPVPDDATEWEKRKARMQTDAVTKTLETFGFDVNDINEQQQDMLFLRRLRKTQENISAKSIAAIVGLFFTGLGAIIALAFDHFKR